MNVVSLTDYLGYITARLVGFLLRLIPISAGLWIGKRIGQLIYYTNRKRRFIAYRNLKAGLGATTDDYEIRRIVKRMYQNFGQTLAEVLTIPRMTKKYINKYVKIEGLKNVEEAKQRGGGIIFLAAHLDNWELMCILGPAIGYPMMVLAREQKHSRLNDLLNQYREITGSKMIKKGFALRDMLIALRNNNIIGMLVDQDAGKTGVFVDFFGRKTSTARGPMSFALKTGATILPVFTIRQKGPFHKIIVERPLTVARTDTTEELSIKRGLQEFAGVLESYIRKNPDQWLWVHKRCKSTPSRRVLILSDEKAGHLNQSIAVAELIKKHRTDTTYEILPVHFRNKMLKTVFKVLTPVSCMRRLKYFLTEDSYNKIMRVYADIVISCGSSLEGVNLLLSKGLGAKKILIMKPSMLNVNKFDLVIAPAHDRLKDCKNVLVTKGAPVRISDEKLKKDSTLLEKGINLEKDTRIGLLIGGDNPEFRMTAEMAKTLTEEAIKLADKIDADILVTTSRRTTGEVEKVIKERLATHPRCKLCVIANEKNIDEAPIGILGLCQIAIVSQESISMVSEAASSGNHVFVFKLEKKKDALKHELFLKDLQAGGYVKVVEPHEVCATIETAWKKKMPLKRLEDTSKIYEAVKRVI